MVTIKNKELERVFGWKVIKGINVVGFDTALRTGWCRIETGKTSCKFDFGFIKVESKEQVERYKEFIKKASELVKPNDRVVIEETYYSRNPNTFRLLSRLGALVFAVSYLALASDLKFLSAIDARKSLGLPSNVKKEVVHAKFHQKFDHLKIDDPDIIDGVVLALNGIFEKNTLI